MITLEEHERKMDEFHKRGLKINTGVLCPECNGELYHKGNMLLVSYPPKQPVYCEDCRYETTITV